MKILLPLSTLSEINNTMKNTNIERSRLAQFCDTIIMQAREALYDREEDILKAWHENIEEAQQNDKKFPPLKLSIGATVDLEESKIETTLRFTAVYQSRIEAEIEDPNQPDLPGVSKSLEKTLGKYVKAVIDDNDRKIQDLGKMAETVYDSKDDEEYDLAKDDSIPLGERMRRMMDEDDGPVIVDAADAESTEPTGGDWTNELLEETLVSLLDTPTDRQIDFLDQVFGDGTAGPFIEYIIYASRPSALLTQQAKRAAIRGEKDNLTTLVGDGARMAMKRLENAGTAKKIMEQAKELITLLVPIDLAEFDLLLEGGCALPLGVRNMIRKATDAALANSDSGEEIQPEGGDDY